MQPVVLAVLASITAHSEFIPSPEQKSQLQELLSVFLASDIATDERPACAPFENLLSEYEYKVQAPRECPKTAGFIYADAPNRPILTAQMPPGRGGARKTAQRPATL